MHIIHLYIILMEVMSYYYSFQCDGLGGGGMPVLFNVHNYLHCIFPSLLSNDSKERERIHKAKEWVLYTI